MQRERGTKRYSTAVLLMTAKNWIQLNSIKGAVSKQYATFLQKGQPGKVCGYYLFPIYRVFLEGYTSH